MGIQYHPDLGEALWCEYTGMEPEMVKRRLCVVIVPRSAQRSRLTTVVPISATPPDVVMAWHVKLARDPLPNSKVAEVWVKCDMINAVSFNRLSGNYIRWNGERKYQKMKISMDELKAIRAGVRAALGLNNAPTAGLEVVEKMGGDL